MMRLRLQHGIVVSLFGQVLGEKYFFYMGVGKKASCRLGLELLDWKIPEVLVQNLQWKAEAGPLTCQPVGAPHRAASRELQGNTQGLVDRTAALTSIALH